MNHLPISIRDLLYQRRVEAARVELKKDWNEGPTAQQVLRTICAFANDFYNVNGGYVVLGVEEKNGVARLPPRGLEAGRIEAIQRWIRGNCRRLDPTYQPVLSPEVVDGRHVLVIWAPASRVRPHSLPGERTGDRRFWIRLGADTVEARGAELTELLQLTTSVPFDGQRAGEYSVDDLRIRLVREFLHEVGSTLVDEPDDREIYRHLGLVERVNEHEVPLNIALLFFSDAPDRIFPGARIDVVHFRDGAGGDVLEEHSFRGPLHRQVADCMGHLRARLPTRIRKYPDRPEASVWESFPLAAVEEAVVNAVHHRDYHHARDPTLIYVYPNELEVTSYPGPMPGLRLEEFRAGRVRRVPARNARIGELLKELRLAEVRRTGLAKIFRAMEENGSPPPRFDFDEGRTFFTVTLSIHPGFREEAPGSLDASRPVRQTTEYLDLEVRVDRNTSGDLEVQILDSPRDRRRSRFEPPYTAQGSAELLTSLECLLEHYRALPPSPATGGGDLPDLGEVGRRLFAALFPPALQPTLDASLSRRRPLRLRLSFDTDDDVLAHVAALPWEVLYHPDRQQFLARQPQLALVRYVDVPMDIERLYVSSRLRILLVSPAPTDCRLIEPGTEARQIEELLGQIAGITVERVEPPTLDRLLEQLEQSETHAIHFAGHGGYDETLGEGGLFFERSDRIRQVINGRQLADRLAPFFATLRLVVLNTCIGATERRRAEHGPLGSVSSALIAKGLSAVVGMQFSISHTVAERFAETFYRNLVETGHVETATAEARRELYRWDRNSPEWMIPVIETRAPNGRLFDRGFRQEADERLRIGVRSLFGWGVEIEDWSHVSLPLTFFFRGRQPLEKVSWQADIYGRLATFLRKSVAGYKAVHFDLAVHLSLAFAAGYLLDVETGIDVTVRQRLARGTEDWRLDDPPLPGAVSWETAEHPVVGGGEDVALAVSCTRPILTSVAAYVEKSVPSVGKIVELRPPQGGPGQLVVQNGWHAFRLAEAISRLMHDLVPGDWPGTFHLFYAGPNGLLFFLGRLSRGPRRIQLYEYDFDAEADRSYTPSLSFPPPAYF